MKIATKEHAMDVQEAITMALEPRDGPNEWFAKHHEVVTRGGKSTGKRVRSQLEKFLLMGDISPAESEAGRRFCWSYEVGCSGGGRSCLSMTVSRGSSDAGADMRHQAFIAYDEARMALDGRRSTVSLRFSPTAVMVRFCVEDVSVSEIASETMAVSSKTAKKKVCDYLATLAAHYDMVDKKQGRSTTAYTREAALRRFEPLDKLDEETARVKREKGRG